MKIGFLCAPHTPVDSLRATTHLRSCSALLRFMYCLTVCCTNGPDGENKVSTHANTINRDNNIINVNAAGLTPTVGHDLQGQRQQVIERSIQHD